MALEELKKLIEEFENIENAMDSTQVGDEETLVMLGLGDNWDELSEIREQKIKEIKEAITNLK